MRKIIIAGSVDSMNQKLQRALLDVRTDYRVQLCRSGGEALQIASGTDAGVVICCKLRDMPDVSLARLLPQSFDVISLLPPGQNSGAYISNLISLNLPLNRMEFINTVNMLAGTDVTVTKARTKAEEDAVSSAKRILMQNYRISERDAYNMLRRRSMDCGKRMADIAKLVIDENF